MPFLLEDNPEDAMEILHTQCALSIDELEEFSQYHIRKILHAFCAHEAALTDPEGEFDVTREDLRRAIEKARHAVRSLLH